MPFVCIILVNYGNYLDTIECLESVLRLNYADYQVIVIDNNSVNRSYENIIDWLSGKLKLEAAYGSPKGLITPAIIKPIPFIAYSFDGEKIEVRERVDRAKGVLDTGEKNTSIAPLILIRSRINLGFSGANNLGAKFALNNHSPQYFWFLNNDTIVDNDALNELVFTLNKEAGIGAVGSKILFYRDPQRIQYLGGAELGHYCVMLPDRNKKDYGMQDRVIRGRGYITGTSFFIKKEVIDKVGFWDEKFFLFSEDVDYSIRIRNAGYKLYFSARSRIYHKEHSSLGTKFVAKKFLVRKLNRLSFESFDLFAYHEIRSWVYFNKKHKNIFLRVCDYSLFLPCYFLSQVLFIIIFDDHKSKRIRRIVEAIKDGWLV